MTPDSARWICLFVIFVVIFVMAWQCDDAWHAHRMSWNLVHGNGFVYNPGERVSATTAPLYTLVNTALYGIIGDIYWSTLLLNLICSMIAIYVMQKTFCRNAIDIFITTCLLMASTSFVSYTTSGLENSMLFLLSAMILKLFFERQSFEAKDLILISFASSLLITTRMDNFLIILPLLIYVFLLKSQNKLLAILYGLIGMAPFIVWEIFSILYYGFPFPNTAYAKLNTGCSLSSYLSHGRHYFLISSLRDTIVTGVPLLFIVYSILKKDFKHVMVSFGMVLYMIYILYIGGDFMIGRHLTVPFFISVFCIIDLLWRTAYTFESGQNEEYYRKPIIAVIIVCIIFQSLSIYKPIFLNIFGEINKDAYWVADEREVYFPTTSLYFRTKLSSEKGISPDEITAAHWGGTKVLDDMRASNNKSDIIPFAPGILAFQAHDLYVNDPIALGDPLLARIPMRHELSNWRVGHIFRDIPNGYRETIQSGINQIVDPSLHEYYDKLCLITRSKDLFSPERIKTIFDMNVGKYNHLITEYVKGRNNEQL